MVSQAADRLYICKFHNLWFLLITIISSGTPYEKKNSNKTELWGTRLLEREVRHISTALRLTL
jgi:hypothetical protein